LIVLMFTLKFKLQNVMKENQKGTV
jgi:hypothetical protein